MFCLSLIGCSNSPSKTNQTQDNQTQNNQVQNNYNTGGYVDEYDERITKIERQIRRLDQRLRKLESNTGIIEETDSNLYMI